MKSQSDHVIKRGILNSSPELAYLVDHGHQPNGPGAEETAWKHRFLPSNEVKP